MIHTFMGNMGIKCFMDWHEMVSVFCINCSEFVLFLRIDCIYCTLVKENDARCMLTQLICLCSLHLCVWFYLILVMLIWLM